MRKLIITLALLMWGGSAWGADATCYVNPDGTNTSPYASWGAGADKPSTCVTYLNGQTVVSGHTLYIAPKPGGYTDNLDLSDGDTANITVIGTVSNSSTSAAHMGSQPLIIATNAQHGMLLGRSGAHVSNLAVTGASTGKDCVVVSGTGTNYLDNMWIYASSGVERYMFNGGTTYVLKNSLIEGNLASATTIWSPSTGSKIEYTKIYNNETGTFAINHALIKTGTGTLEIDNSQLYADVTYAIWMTGVGSIIVYNSIVAGGSLDTAAYNFLADAGAITVYNSELIYPFWNTLTGISHTTGTGVITLNASNHISLGTRYNSHKRPAIIIPRGDPSSVGEITYWNNWAAQFGVSTSYGAKGTIFVQSPIAAKLTGLQTLVTDGSIEIGGHTVNHNNMTSTTAFTCTGGNSVTVNARPTDTIVVNGVTLTGMSAKTLGTTSTAGTILKFAADNGATGCALTSGIYSGTLGESLVSGTYAATVAVGLNRNVGTAGNPPTAGFFYSEILGNKTEIEAAALTPAQTVYSFAYPGNNTDATSRSALFNSGFLTGSAVTDSTDANRGQWHLSNIDVYQLGAIKTINFFGSTQLETAQKVRSIAEALTYTGGIVEVLTHGASSSVTGIADNGSGLIRVTSAGHPMYENGACSVVSAPDNIGANGEWSTINVTATTFDLSGSTYSNGCSGGTCGAAITYMDTDLTRWQWAMDVLKTEFPSIIITSAKGAMDYLMANGWATTDGGITYSKTLTDQSDYRLKSSSPCKNGGVDVGLTTDFLGNKIRGLPDIGAYEFIPKLLNSGLHIGPRIGL
jgi:hypothetical protein